MVKWMVRGFLQIKNVQIKKFNTRYNRGNSFICNFSSNSSLYKFPNNTLTEYRVGLPQTVA